MYKSTKKIPTIVALLLLLIGIGGGIFLVEQRTSGPTKASVTSQPQSIQITNIADSSFSIIWLTEEPTTGTVNFGTSPSQLDSLAFDDRDIDNEAKPYTTHQITLRNLTPSSTYYFAILSGDKKFINDNKPYSITTPQKPIETNNLEPAYGQVLTMQNTPAEGSLVILNLPRSLPLSTLVKSSGNWLIPLNIARDINLSLYKAATDSATPISITVLASTVDKATATTDTKNDSPVPPITLGKTYNFEGLESKKPKDETEKIAMEDNEIKEEVLGQSSTNQVNLLVPQEGSTFVSARPLFRGLGISGEEVLIEITGGPQVSGKTTVTKEGRWSWSPPKDLTPEKHKVTITTVDENGEEISFVRNFLVFKSGTQVLGDATPSASTPTPTPTIPSSVGAPPSTPSATLQPLFTPTPTPSPATIPVAGTFEITLILVGSGAVISLIGLAKFISTS